MIIGATPCGAPPARNIYPHSQSGGASAAIITRVGVPSSVNDVSELLCHKITNRYKYGLMAVHAMFVL